MANKKLWLLLLVSSLGFFVDVYDIVLFSAVRVTSLQSLGVPNHAITQVGLSLMNIQVIGMLLGGITWGILADKFGRLSILFGSIFMYSAATLANAFISHVETYQILRFLAGFGLAGELGAGITLVSELMSQRNRGWGAMLIVVSGALGGVAGGLAGHLLSWQTAYILGGLGGFVLLLLRMGLTESSLYQKIKKDSHLKKGSLLLFIKQPKLFFRYLQCLLVGIPFWVFIGLFMAISPELGKALGVATPVRAGVTLACFNSGLAVGEIVSGCISQWLGSRKKVVLGYLSLAFITILILFNQSQITENTFYIFTTILGFSSGFWVIFILIASEQFGTNIRATVTVSLPNMVRAMLVPCAMLLTLLQPHFGILWGFGIICLTSLAFGLIASGLLAETFSRNLDFVET